MLIILLFHSHLFFETPLIAANLEILITKLIKF